MRANRVDFLRQTLPEISEPSQAVKGPFSCQKLRQTILMFGNNKFQLWIIGLYPEGSICRGEKMLKILITFDLRYFLPSFAVVVVIIYLQGGA